MRSRMVLSLRTVKRFRTWSMTMTSGRAADRVVVDGVTGVLMAMV